MSLVTIEQVRAALNLGSDASHDTELELYVDAADEHVAARLGSIDVTQYTETVTFHGGVLVPRRWPIVSVVSITDENGTAYTTDFTIGDAGFSIEHDTVTSGEWTVVYTAGFAAVPADLKLAVLEDIRGLYQPGQIGPPAAFGAFGADSTDVGASYRPVRMWPRVDAWLSYRFGPVVA